MSSFKEALSSSRVRFISDASADRMKEIMLQADIAISAAGQTLYELARVGVPTITVAVADNQVNVMQGWQRTGAIEYSGRWDEPNIINNIYLATQRLMDRNLRQQRSRIARQIIDGKGSQRVVEFLLKDRKLNNWK